MGMGKGLAWSATMGTIKMEMDAREIAVLRPGTLAQEEDNKTATVATPTNRTKFR